MTSDDRTDISSTRRARHRLPLRLIVRRPLAAVVAAVALTAGGTGCGDDDDGGDSGRKDVDVQPVMEVGSGAGPTCLLVEDDLAAEVEELPVVGCDVEHSHEIYSTVGYDAKDVYPGLDELTTFAEVECLRRFETFVGISAFDSSLSFSWMLPSLSSWNEENDRDVLCTLSDADGAPLRASMRGTQR